MHLERTMARLPEHWGSARRILVLYPLPEQESIDGSILESPDCKPAQRPAVTCLQCMQHPGTRSKRRPRSHHQEAEEEEGAVAASQFVGTHLWEVSRANYPKKWK